VHDAEAHSANETWLASTASRDGGVFDFEVTQDVEVWSSARQW
jgi:hypothetical protein